MGEPMNPAEFAQVLRVARETIAEAVCANRADYTMILSAMEAGADALEQLQASRDRQADLEVYAADLHDVLAELLIDAEDRGPLTPRVWDRTRAALATDPPERGRQLRAQLQRLRQLERAVRTALVPWTWSGIDADGKSYQDVVQEVATALAALDQTTPAQEPR